MGFWSLTEQPVVDWSYSRRDLISQCNRRYYYHYYGFSKRTAIEERNKPVIRFLKSLDNIYLRMGSVLHLIIQTYFKKAQAGDIWSLDRLLGWANKIYREDLSYNREYNQNRPPSRIDAYRKLLIEFYYQLKDAEEIYADSFARLTNGLRNFCTSDIYLDFRNNGITREAFIEKRFSLNRGQYKVKGKIDLAYSKEDRAVIVDWKLGDSSRGHENLQLLSYAIWASEDRKLSSENIQIYMAHLNGNIAMPFSVSDEGLTSAEARIAQDVETMTYLDKYGKAAVAEAFSKCDQLKICGLCQYQTVCHGRVILGSD